MKRIKKFLPLVAVGVLSAVTTIGGVKYFQDSDTKNQDANYFQSAKDNARFASVGSTTVGNEFVKASKEAVPAVVTIMKYDRNVRAQVSQNDLFKEFFGNPFEEQMPRQNQKSDKNPDMPSGLGSGVIISPDGYIISNNHVVSNATKLEVILSDKKKYTATLVGTDPSTDIALLKIEEKGLPFLHFSNSDLVEVGQWVLAIGNPMGLNSTVTAGIISAKGRSIDLLRSQSSTPIESFIQTDAAINRGNSGGALVNTNGDLVGINSAISSSTGVYEGYGFAVPSNLARKVVEDLKKFGLVQRAFLGVNAVDLSNDEFVKNYNTNNNTDLKTGAGVYVISVTENSGAEDAGLKKGDIITQLDNQKLLSFSDMSLIIGSKRPGDKIKIIFTRNGKTNEVETTVKDQKGNTKSRSVSDLSVAEKLGASFRELSDKEKTYFGISKAVVVTNVQPSGLLSQIPLAEGYIILEINNKPVGTQKDIETILKNFQGTVSVKYLDDYGRVISRGFKM